MPARMFADSDDHDGAPKQYVGEQGLSDDSGASDDAQATTGMMRQ